MERPKGAPPQDRVLSQRTRAKPPLDALVGHDAEMTDRRRGDGSTPSKGNPFFFSFFFLSHRGITDGMAGRTKTLQQGAVAERDKMTPQTIPVRRLTYRESCVVRSIIEGKNKGDALRAAGFPESLALHPKEIITLEVQSVVDEMQAALAQYQLDHALIDATEIHDYLTEALRADMRDIRNDDGSFKPQSEWPPIWGRMMEAGDVEVERTFDRSQDGKDAEKRGGWDESGTVTKVKLKFSSRVKLLELAMKHKGVNAMVEAKSPDVHLHLHAEITSKLQGALARKARIIEADAQKTT